MTKPQEIREYIAGKLSTPTITGISQVYSSFHLPKQDDQSDIIVVYDTSEEASEPMDRYRLQEVAMTITIEINAQTSSGNIDAIMDDYAGTVRSRIATSFRDDPPNDKPYNTLKYRGRDKAVASNGAEYIGAIQMRFEVTYDLTDEP